MSGVSHSSVKYLCALFTIYVLRANDDVFFYELTLNWKFLMNKWSFFPENKGAQNILSTLYAMRKYVRTGADRRARFPNVYRKRSVRDCTVLPVRNLLFEQDSDIRVSNLFAGAPRCRDKKKAALCTDNLKNISVLSSAAYVTKLKCFSSVTLYGYIEFWKIQLVNENISRPSTRTPGASRRALSISSIPGDRPEQ